MTGYGWQEKAGNSNEIILRAYEFHPEAHPNAQGTLYMAKLLEERSNGRIKMKVYVGAQLGEGEDINAALKDGILDISRDPLPPTLDALKMPFVFRDSDHVWKTLDGPLRKIVDDELEKNGLICLGIFDAGARSFYTTKAVLSPDDLRGMKIRVGLGNETMMEAVKTIGAEPVQLAYNDMYPAFQTGNIAGAENNTPSYLTSKHYELAKYYIMDEHVFSPEAMYITKSSWDQFSTEDQKLLKECGATAAEYQRKLWSEFTAKSLKELEGQGVTIIKPDKESFRKAMVPLYDKFPQYKALINQIQAVK